MASKYADRNTITSMPQRRRYSFYEIGGRKVRLSCPKFRIDLLGSVKVKSLPVVEHDHLMQLFCWRGTQNSRPESPSPVSLRGPRKIHSRLRPQAKHVLQRN